MAENQNPSTPTDGQAAAAGSEEKASPVFNLQRSYVKDMSLEMPNAPEIFLEQEGPTVAVDINVGAQRLAETVFESSVTASVTTRIEDKVLYLVEVTQGGIFEIANVPAEQLDPLIGIVCPTMLYPYLRAAVADVINRTSLPALHLSEVNFQALYEQRVAEQQAAAGAEAGEGAPQGDQPLQ